MNDANVKAVLLFISTHAGTEAGAQGMSARLAEALFAAREEGRRAGLEEAKVVAFDESEARGSVPERLGARRVYSRIYALAVSDTRGKVEGALPACGPEDREP